MALAPAERQRRYRASHVMVPRQQEPGDQAPQPSKGTRLDLTDVHAAMWALLDLASHPADTVPALRQQLWALGRVVHELIVALDNHHNCT